MERGAEAGREKFSARPWQRLRRPVRGDDRLTVEQSVCSLATVSGEGTRLKRLPCQSAWLASLVLSLIVIGSPSGALAQDGGARLQLRPEAVRLKAQVLLQEENYYQAGRMLQAYLRRNPDDGEAWLLQARVFEGIDRLDLALKALERAGERQGVHLTKARILLRQGKKDEALAEAQEAVRRYPNFGNAWHFLGYLHVTRNEFRPAVEAFEQAEKNGTTLQIANNFYWGQSLYQLGQYDASEDKLQRAREFEAAGGADTSFSTPIQDFLDAILIKRRQLARKRPPEAQKTPAPAKPGRPWTAYALLGLEFDSNVTLAPDGEPTFPREEGVRNVLAFGGDVRLLRRGAVGMRAKADAVIAYDYLFDAGQLFSVQAGVYSPIRFKIGGRAVQVAPLYLTRVVWFGAFDDDDAFDGGTRVAPTIGAEPFSIDLEGGAQFRWQHGERATFSTSLSYYFSAFTSEPVSQTAPGDLRDSNNLRLSVGETLLFDTRRKGDLRLDLNLLGALRFVQDRGNQEAENFSYWAVEPQVRVDWNAWRELFVGMDAAYRFEDHYESDVTGEKRRDQTLGLGAGVRCKIGKWGQGEWWANLRYLFEQNFSTLNSSPDLEYTKHVVSGFVQVNFQ